MCETASHFLQSTICLDSYGLFAAVAKDEPSPGSDHSMVFHAKAARGHLDNHNIEHMCWTDNRDMLADGLAKGKPPRDIINQTLATGNWHTQQPHKTLTSSEKRGAQAHKHDIDNNIDKHT